MGKWLSFWQAAELSREEDVLECEEYYGNIVNNGDFTFMWEESWKPVQLSGEHLGFKWRVKVRRNIDPKDITKHIGGILCACYDCRSKKGYTVRKAIIRDVKVNPSDIYPMKLERNYIEYELQKFVPIAPLGEDRKPEYYFEYIQKY
jgi:hypothetical protein